MNSLPQHLIDGTTVELFREPEHLWIRIIIVEVHYTFMVLHCDW